MVARVAAVVDADELHRSKEDGRVCPLLPPPEEVKDEAS
jgi:hypothetical protein